MLPGGVFREAATLVHRLAGGTMVQYELPRDRNKNAARASAIVVDRSGAVWIALNELEGGALIATLDPR
jgi:hypothetical protein